MLKNRIPIQSMMSNAIPLDEYLKKYQKQDTQETKNTIKEPDMDIGFNGSFNNLNKFNELRTQNKITDIYIDEIKE